MRVYLAGPEVFLPDALAIGREKQAICARFGLQGLYPLDSGLELGGLAPREAAFAIYRGNLGLMRRADALIANLTPFRGPSGDAGTAFEVGFMAALDKPLFAYSNAAGSYAERVRLRPRDEDLAVEDFGLVDNLMLDGALDAGCFLTADVLTGEVPPEQCYRDLTLFTACVAAAAARLTGSAAPA